MDEVVLHATQKFESLQVHLYSSCQHLKLGINSYLDQIHRLLSEFWEGPTGDQIRENVQKLWQFVVELSQEAKTIILNPSLIQKSLSRCINYLSQYSNELSRRSIYFGCITFVFGGLIGLCLGLSWHKPLPPAPLMKAVVCTNYNGLETLALVEDIPAPVITSSDEILIQVKAASIDFIDIKICSGYGRVLRKQLNRNNYNVHSEFPVILGRDCSGIVVEVGQKCSKFEVGDEVWFCVPYYQPGTLSEYVVVRECLVAHKPKGVGFEAAASIPYAGAIAWDAMVNRAGLGPANTRGRRILVHSGCSAVGCIILQLARIWGAHVTATCSMRAVPVAQALGADEIVPFEEDVQKLLSLREPFDVIFNTVGPLVHETCLKLAKPGGLVITTIATKIASDTYGFFFGSFCALWIRIKCLAQSLIGPCSWGSVLLGPQVLDQLCRLVEDGSIQPVVDKVYSPQDAELAFQHVDSADAIGRTIIKFRYHRPLPHLQHQSTFYGNYPWRQQSPYPPSYPSPGLISSNQPPRGLS